MKISFDYDVTCMIMGGGQGVRLYPLTKDRSKPAVPLGTKYRLIDIPISNCLNSGLNRIYILTQFNSTSLHRHIQRAYHFDRFSRGFVEILAAQQTPQYDLKASWYQGTSDAVRKNMPRLEESGSSEVLILSGDQIYQMNFREVLDTHRGDSSRGPSEVTIASLLVTREQARQFGVLQIDETGEVVRFVEKPGKDDKLLDSLEAPQRLVENFGLSQADGPWFLANMGIYVFQMDVLKDALTPASTDFGKEVLPAIIKGNRVRCHLFHGYWEDIGTISSFLRANLDLGLEHPNFNFYSAQQPVYTRARLLPASKVSQVTSSNSLIAEGCRIAGAEIVNSLIGVRTVIAKNVTIKNSYIMGTDHFETADDLKRNQAIGLPDIGIGPGTHIENAIVDKNTRIGADVVIKNLEGHREYEDGNVFIRDGIVIVPRNGVLLSGYKI